eukprot:3428796-Rhodomonas_salina.1
MGPGMFPAAAAVRLGVQGVLRKVVCSRQRAYVSTGLRVACRSSIEPTSVPDIGQGAVAP